MSWNVKSLLALATLALLSVLWITLGPSRPSAEAGAPCRCMRRE